MSWATYPRQLTSSKATVGDDKILWAEAQRVKGFEGSYTALERKGRTGTQPRPARGKDQAPGLECPWGVTAPMRTRGAHRRRVILWGSARAAGTGTTAWAAITTDGVRGEGLSRVGFS